MKNILLALITVFSSAGFAGEYIIKMKDASPKLMSLTAQQLQLNVVDVHQKAQLVQVEIDDKNIASAYKQIKNNKNVEYIVESFKLKTKYGPINLIIQWDSPRWRIREARLCGMILL